MIPVTTFAGRTVAVFGMARSGLAAARALIAGGATVACWDDGERGRASASVARLPLVDLREADWSRFAALVLAPGVPLTHPEPHWAVKRARAAGVEVIGDTELFFRELALLPEASRPKTIAITGTNGKSTTTALAAHLLSSASTQVEMGGNIGEAVLGLHGLNEVDVYVLELSSYQIDLTPTLAPDVGILLNLSPDHLDRHGTMEHYSEVKERLIVGSKTAIVGLDDHWCREIALRRLANKRETLGIHIIEDATRPADAVSDAELTVFKKAGGQVILANANDEIWLDGGEELAELRGIPTLKGAHNAQNAAAAICAARQLGLTSNRIDFRLTSFASDYYPQALRRLRSYPGLHHRMELLGSVGDVAFVNDSKATNADSTAKALNSFGAGLHWILGGKAKDGGIESLTGFFGGVAHAYLIGEASDTFAKTLAAHGVLFTRCGTLARAVDEANQNAAPGPATVLLSPACASFDQFKDFEDRGDQFRKFVQALPGFVPYGAKAQ